MIQLEYIRIFEFAVAWIATTAFLIWYLPRGWFRSVVGWVTVMLFSMLWALLSLGIVRLGFILAGYSDYAGREEIATVLVGVLDLALIGATVSGIRAYSRGRAAARHERDSS